VIELKQVEKHFGDLHALQGMSFTAQDGQITGLIGPNGAGKTTALRILSTVMRPTAGQALVDGLDVVQARAQVQRKLGVLSDARGLYPRLTTREHIAYFAKLHRLPPDIVGARMDALADALKMEEIMDRRVKGFSKGQALKVALARAMIHDPSNLLLDEPTNGLDIAASRSMRHFIKELRDRGRCIIFCSHIMQEVAALCDQLVVVAKGRVVAAGSPDALRAQTGEDDLEDVFLSLTGLQIDADGNAKTIADKTLCEEKAKS
jgi:sodium transport system ATP-binding protein